MNVHTSLRPVQRLGLGLNLIGLDNHNSLIDRAGLVLGHRASRLTSGKARRNPLGLGLLPLGLGLLRVVKRQVVIDQHCRGIGVRHGGAEQGQLGLRRPVQYCAGSLALRDGQLFPLLAHDVDDRAAPQQIRVPCVLADVGARLARGLIAHLITDRVRGGSG